MSCCRRICNRGFEDRERRGPRCGCPLACGHALGFELLGRRAQQHDVDTTVQAAASPRRIRRYGAVLPISDCGQACRRNAGVRNQVPEHVGCPRSGQLPVRRELGGLDRNVVGVAFNTNVVGDFEQLLCDAVDHCKCVALEDCRARAEEAGFGQADRQATLIEAHADLPVC